MNSGGNERSIVRFSRCGNFGSDGPEDFYVFTEEIQAKRGVYVLDKVFIRPVKVEVKGVTEGEVLLSLDGKTHTLKRGLTLLSERKGKEFDGDGKAFLASEAVYAEWL